MNPHHNTSGCISPTSATPLVAPRPKLHALAFGTLVTTAFIFTAAIAIPLARPGPIFVLAAIIAGWSTASFARTYYTGNPMRAFIYSVIIYFVFAKCTGQMVEGNLEQTLLGAIQSVTCAIIGCVACVCTAWIVDLRSNFPRAWPNPVDRPIAPRMTGRRFVTWVLPVLSLIAVASFVSVVIANLYLESPLTGVLVFLGLLGLSSSLIFFLCPTPSSMWSTSSALLGLLVFALVMIQVTPPGFSADGRVLGMNWCFAFGDWGLPYWAILTVTTTRDWFPRGSLRARRAALVRHDGFRGLVCIVTGASSGLGRAICQGLAEQGATVVMACRNIQKAELARSRIQKRNISGKLVVMRLDLTSQKSICQFVAEFKHKYRHLHVLVNNAGIVLPDRVLTEDGYETQLAVNCLGPFVLAKRLLLTMRSSRPTLILNITSDLHRRGFLKLDDLNLQEGYHFLSAYAQSQLCKIILFSELAYRLRGSGISVNQLHPGGVATSLFRHLRAPLRWLFGISGVLKSSPQAATRPILHRVRVYRQDDSNGKYFHRWQPRSPSIVALDQNIRKQVWATCQTLTENRPVRRRLESGRC